MLELLLASFYKTQAASAASSASSTPLGLAPLSTPAFMASNFLGILRNIGATTPVWPL
jgi:hypothetical protein